MLQDCGTSVAHGLGFGLTIPGWAAHAGAVFKVASWVFSYCCASVLPVKSLIELAQWSACVRLNMGRLTGPQLCLLQEAHCSVSPLAV